ncbi:MAG TPA: S41 family peptidase [Flavobacteriales bacterium]
MNNERLDKYTTDQTPQNSKRSAAQPFLFAGLIIAGMFIGTNLGDKNPLKVKPSVEENPNKLVSLINFIEDNYVDSVDKSKLIDDAIKSLLANLDPHSYYMKAEDMQFEHEKMKGAFSGIGIEFLILRDTLMVVRTIEGGPSSRVGIKSGDRIISVNGENITGETLNSDKAQKLLKGERGTEVKVSIYRPTTNDTMEYVITRGNIPIESVTASFMANDSVGYVKVERFAEKTYNEFSYAVDQLRKKGCTSLIIDMRGNGGGLMSAATKMVEEFLDEGKTIVYTEGLHTGKKIEKSSRNGRYRDMNVVVLIDQSSASASEIVAGALQDWDRSVTVGRRSFGKGLVQHEISLADQSALRLTVARYYTPTGRCIQKPYGDTIDYAADFHKRFVSGELTNADSIHFPDSLKYKTPGGRIVYGGGGIMPDVFVPMDSVYFSGLLSEIAYSGVIRDYCFNYMDKNRKELNKYESAEEFISKFTVSDAMFNGLLEVAEKQKIQVNKAVIKKITPQLKTRMKAQLARNLYGDTAMYEVLLETDQDFRMAMKVATNYKDYSTIPAEGAERDKE